ncbi:MAG: hypothetical protein J6M36_12375 [Prevotella sp.]|nr:hypothetical protein [Prevotella sp.]
MKDNKKQIWAYYSMKKGTYDNDYYFYEDGTILHHYDRTMKKLDIEEYVSPSDISESEKEQIISKCETECNQEIVNQIKIILDIK